MWYLIGLLLVLLSICSKETLAAHPHPDLTNDYQIEFDGSTITRRSSSIQHHNTELINPRLCHGLNTTECMDMDSEAIEQSRRLRGIAQKTGFLRILVVCIYFPEHASRGLPSTDNIKELLLGQKTSDNIPTGSFKQYMELNSYDKLSIVSRETSENCINPKPTLSHH